LELDIISQGSSVISNRSEDISVELESESIADKGKSGGTYCLFSGSLRIGILPATTPPAILKKTIYLCVNFFES